ncbi:hypothetical protein BCR43DRAFT_489416 [Syncephalastrum racemosum]|uniref:Uncharacterized protein n=1 Tax=Syncephalastrum racemosum TaxID=13706 RepID=A0A1X2HE53_SYNRA|nr:hypothetical protein BCR43DRAFT_489416 [Syncephalastrum racemosum]
MHGTRSVDANPYHRRSSTLLNLIFPIPYTPLRHAYNSRRARSEFGQPDPAQIIWHASPPKFHYTFDRDPLRGRRLFSQRRFLPVAGVVPSTVGWQRRRF